MSKKTFVWRKLEGEGPGDGGFEPTDILCQHYGDDGFKTIVLDQQDFERLTPWKLCSLLNQTYESGRRDSMEALRNFIGVK